MGFVVMGPSAYLPTFAQSVFGLGAAAAAGRVLASMSIGWPTASVLYGRLYLRIGFRRYRADRQRADVRRRRRLFPVWATRRRRNRGSKDVDYGTSRAR